MYILKNICLTYFVVILTKEKSLDFVYAQLYSRGSLVLDSVMILFKRLTWEGNLQREGIKDQAYGLRVKRYIALL